MKSLLISMVDEVQIYSERRSIYEQKLDDLNKMKVIDLNLQEPNLRNVVIDRN